MTRRKVTYPRKNNLQSVLTPVSERGLIAPRCPGSSARRAGVCKSPCRWFDAAPGHHYRIQATSLVLVFYCLQSTEGARWAPVSVSWAAPFDSAPGHHYRIQETSLVLVFYCLQSTEGARWAPVSVTWAAPFDSAPEHHYRIPETSLRAGFFITCNPPRAPNGRLCR